MLQFSIGVSALQTAQQGLAIAGNNLANASTPGYHRQVAELGTAVSTTLNGLQVGSGVNVTSVNRMVSDQLDAALNQQTSLNGLTDTSLNTSTQIQNIISPTLNSPATQIEALFSKLQTLSSSPSSGAAQQAAVASAQSVVTAFNSAASQLTYIKNNLDQSVDGTVGQINSLTKQLGELNVQIGTANALGNTPNTLLDQQSQLLNNLSQLIGIQTQTASDGQVTVFSGGAAIVNGPSTIKLQTRTDDNGVTTIGLVGSDTMISVTSGNLGGFLSQRNTTLADYQNRLDQMASQVAASFNAIQSTGLGTSGGFTQLTSGNAVSSTTAPLSSVGLAVPTQPGTLYLGVTDTTTGKRTVTAVLIDPQNQSLQDAANAISNADPNVNAIVNTQTGTMTLIASPGHTFDFTGGFSNAPATSFAAGTTTTPTLSGAYTGSKNDNYTFTFTSNGTIGSTPNLQAEVTNSAGTVIGTVNIGQGYTPGAPLSIPGGLTLSLSAGTVVSGDTFSTPVASNGDSANVLSSLGLNSLFTGNSAASLSVNSQLMSNPGMIATSRSGAPGDTSNLLRFQALSNTGVLSNGTQTFSQYANTMVSDIGTTVQGLTQQQGTNATLTTNLTNQQQSISGVDTNEELSNILQYQQMFQMAGKYISIINDTMQSLLASL